MASKASHSARAVALGGVFAALAVAIMALGTIIPIATYICPMFCALLLQVVLKLCGSRIAWAWYGAVSLLSLLLSPDKEAAAMFLFLGYYPIVKPWLDRRKGTWLWKGALFNAAVFLMYWILMHLVGMERLLEEFSGMGLGMLAVLLILGNVTFFLLDRLLGMNIQPRKRHGG